MDQETRRAMAKDTEWEEHKIVGVSPETDGWSVQVENEAYLFVRDNGVDSIAPSVGETMRTYGRGHGHPVRGITVGGRVYTYRTEAQVESRAQSVREASELIDRLAPQLGIPKPRDLLVELNNLRRASRAMARLPCEVGVFDEIKPEDMRRVLTRRGWTLTGTQPWPGEPNRVAFETYDHETAQGTSRNLLINCVRVPLDPTAGDWRSTVYDWAVAVAIRHGDVSPPEVLAEAL